MVYKPHVVGALLYYSKRTILHQESQEAAVESVRIYQVNWSDYPAGIKYALFLVSLVDGRVIVGMDNHKPKGPHIHRSGAESKDSHRTVSIESLVVDFDRMVQEEGYQ